MQKAGKYNSKFSLNANIDGMIAFIVRVSVALFLASASALIFVATRLVGFIGFGRGSNGIRQQGLCGLNIRHGSGDNILGQGVGHNRWWNGRNLHSSTPSNGGQNLAPMIIAYT